MYLISKPFTRRELYDLLRQAAIDALCAERPELRRLENQIVHAEIVLPQTGPWKGGAVIEFTIKETTHKDLAAYGELAPATRRTLNEKLKARGAVCLTAQVTDDEELHAEVFDA